MIRKILTIFKRDLKASIRDFITLYIIVVPIIFAIIINVFSPGINDTTVEIALLEGENQAQEEYFKQFAKVETLHTIEEIEEVPDSLLNEREKYWIKFYNSYYSGYNSTLGGDGYISTDDYMKASFIRS